MNMTDFIMEIKEIDFYDNKGVIVEGKIKNGTVSLGDSLEIVGSAIFKTFIASIEKKQTEQHIITDSAKSGEHVRLLLTISQSENINVGHIISTPKLLRPHSKFKSEISFQSKVLKYIVNNSLNVQIEFSENLITNASIYFLDNLQYIIYKNNFIANIELNNPLTFMQGLKFKIHYNNEKIGTGIVTEIIE